jgi:hypothetical protein
MFYKGSENQGLLDSAPRLQDVMMQAQAAGMQRLFLALHDCGKKAIGLMPMG